MMRRETLEMSRESGSNKHSRRRGEGGKREREREIYIEKAMDREIKRRRGTPGTFQKK